jgi:ABC-2 type transport system ATP-binding protein
MNAIEVTSLSKTFTRKMTQKVRALENISFSVPEGRVFGFIGPNGAGKSTTIKILMGLLKADAGMATFYGRDCSEPGARQPVGFLAENPAYYEYLTPRELLSWVGESFGMSQGMLAEKVREVLDMMELSHAADRPIRTLSKGMVQRVGLGQTLVHDPSLYILDEPMSGLDPLGRGLVVDVIKQLKEKGKTVFFSTHIIHDVERVCDDVALISGGTLRFRGAVKGVINESFTRYEVLLRINNGSVTVSDFPSEVAVSVEGDHTRLFIPRDSLEKYMQILLNLGDILSIEPERRSLEQIFLELMKSVAERERL